jgi:holin-like protein
VEDVLLRLIYQFLIICWIYISGIVLVKVLQLPLPGSIVGMFILFLALVSEKLKLEWVENAANLYLKHMSLLFIPPIIGVVLFMDILRAYGWKLFIVLIISSLNVLLGTAGTVELYEKVKGRK